ncbi:MAG: NAD(P)-dependent oxidoreductase [Patescibacteria group bacterium]
MKKQNLVLTDEPFLLPQFVKEIEALKSFSTKTYYTRAIDSEQLIERAKDADHILVDSVTQYHANVLAKIPNLRTILTTSVGVDHIDLSYCAAHDIKVINFPGFNARSVAEAVFAYILALVRKVPAANAHVRGGGWDTFLFQGIELGDTVLGVIGSGSIGSEVIKMGQGMGMKVMCHTKNPTSEKAKRIGLTSFHSLDEVVSSSDYLVVAVPLDASTTNLISKEVIGKMKKSAIFVSIARGGTIDLFALAEALYEQRLSGAALDQLETDPYNVSLADLRLQEMANMPNVLVLPHIAFNTHEANIRLGERMVSELKKLVT